MLLHLCTESELYTTMDAHNTRASNCEEADEDDGTIVSDTELSDLSESSVSQETCTNTLLPVSDGADQPKDPPKSQSPEFEWISSYDKPDPSQNASTCQKRPHIDDWSDDENSVSKDQRCRRQEYKYSDKKAILDYISQTSSYSKVKGRQLWEAMADSKVCPGRTWQSLKEHYIKQIIPNICIFRLPKNIEKLFVAPFPQYREKKHVHFEDDSLKIPEKEFKKGGGNTGARHVTEPFQSFDSPDHSDLSLRKESEMQNKEPPESSSPGTPDIASEWLSADDENESCEDSRERVSEGSQSQFNDVYAEEILKLIGNSDSVDRPPNSSSEIESPDDGPAIGSKTPELLSSEEPTEKEGSVHAMEAERTQIRNGPPATKERSLDEHSGVVSIPDLPNTDDEVPKLPISEVPAEEIGEANSTKVENSQVADREERSSDESFEIETISGVPSSNEEGLILPIRKRIRLNPLSCTPQRTEQSTTADAKPLTPSSWPSIKIVQKLSPNSMVRNSVTKHVSANSEEHLFRTKRRDYTYEDKKAILNYISQTQSYNRVKGRQFWQAMVDHKVCPGRTWQSLKEHYIKQIIPNLCIFRLSEEEERRFLAPFV